MSASQRQTRRRSAKAAFDDDEPMVVKRQKNDATVNGTGKAAGKTNGATAKKAQAASYEEADGDFQFSRTKSRKSRKQPEPAPEPRSDPAEQQAAPVSNVGKGKSAASTPALQDDVAPKKRRSARLSGDKEQHAPEPAAAPEPAKKKPKRRFMDVTPTKNDSGVSFSSGELAVQKQRSPKKIALPFADTPIIKKNKEMRKGSGSGHRRSSSGMRGRRASSLIESGTSNGGQEPFPKTMIVVLELKPKHTSAILTPDDTSPFRTAVDVSEKEREADLVHYVAVPHAEVEPVDFYKHIDQSLPEPRRMNQLLRWCAARALPEKPAGNVKDHDAIMAARAIQQELLNDIANKNEMSNWFDRETVALENKPKKPNPRNLQNTAKLQELEQEVARLQAEKKSWDDLLKSSAHPITAVPSEPSSSDGERRPKSTMQNDPLLQPIEPSILDEDQASILAQIRPSTTDPSTQPSAPQPMPAATSAAELSTRLQTIASSLEPTIDLLADGVHRVGQYRLAVEKVADRILGSTATQLERRDRQAKEKAGTQGVGAMDVLRQLAGVLHANGNGQQQR